MLTCCQLHSPIKKLLNKIENPIHTYVNYHKTHAMATHFSGIGDTQVENPENQDIDNVSEDESQDELIRETANLKQFIEDKNSEPKEAIQEIEQRLNDLTLALHHQNTPIENVLDRYTETLCTAPKENILRQFLITRHTHIKWARLFTA